MIKKFVNTLNRDGLMEMFIEKLMKNNKKNKNKNNLDKMQKELGKMNRLVIAWNDVIGKIAVRKNFKEMVIREIKNNNWLQKKICKFLGKTCVITSLEKLFV